MFKTKLFTYIGKVIFSLELIIDFEYFLYFTIRIKTENIVNAKMLITRKIFVSITKVEFEILLTEELNKMLFPLLRVFSSLSSYPDFIL